MNKKLLMAALAAVLVAPLAANAGIKVYAHLNGEIAKETTTIDTTGPTTNLAEKGNDGADHSGFTVEDNARGRIGVKGSEDLGGGLKGIAGAEWKVDTTQGGQSIGQRAAYAGVKGGFGTFMIGKLKTPYKYFGGVKYDPFVTTNLQARTNGGMSAGAAGKFDGADGKSGYGHNSFQSDNIAYKSPNWGGFKLWVTYGLDQKGDARKAEESCTDEDEDPTTPATCAATRGQGNYGDYQVGAKFGMKGAFPFEVGFVQNFNASRDDTYGGQGDIAAFKVFGSVGFKTGSIKHKIVLQNEGVVESTNADPGVTVRENTEAALFVGYHLKIGKTTIVLQGANTVVDYDGAPQTKGTTSGAGTVKEDMTGTYTALGVVHKLGKKTRIYGGLRNSKWTDYKGETGAEKAESVISVGLRKDI